MQCMVLCHIMNWPWAQSSYSIITNIKIIKNEKVSRDGGAKSTQTRYTSCKNNIYGTSLHLFQVTPFLW